MWLPFDAAQYVVACVVAINYNKILIIKFIKKLKINAKNACLLFLYLVY
jgi:hypothetical protein